MEDVEASLARLRIADTKLLQEVTSYIMQTNQNKKVFHRKQTAMLQKEHTEIENKLDRLLDLMMEGSITKEEFEVKKRKLKDRHYDIGELIKSLDEADRYLHQALICLINLANGALEKFKGSRA